MINFSNLLYSTSEQPTLLENLALSAGDSEFVRSARLDIRNHLRAELANELKRKGHDEDAVDPRFFTQGSYAYGTLNAPAKSPQQADIDDGVYLPLSFVSSTGRPSAAATIFFEAVETVLASLVKSKGWELVTTKSTCVRIVLNDRIHVDLPLYAIPDEEFVKLQKVASARAIRLDAEIGGIDESVDHDIWEMLDKDKVLLAHRDENWILSDPRPVKAWFLSEVELLGEQYRRVVRYLKALRDWYWATGGPSSILLMVASAKAFEKRPRRDDLALLEVLEALPAILRDGVCNPVEPHESLTDRLGKPETENAAVAIEEMARSVRRALGSSPEAACATMLLLFGKRFPNAPSRVKPTTVEETVKVVPAQVVPSPLVGRTQAG